MPPDETKLIQDAQAGNLEAFNALVLIYQDSLYTLAYRIMGEPAAAADATQEAFITAYRKLHTYRGGSFKSWLGRIVTNVCYDTLRYHKRRPAIGFDDLPDAERDDGAPIPSPAESPEQAAQRAELNAAIQQCIGALSPEQRLVLVMSDVEGYNYQEIAQGAALSLGTVKSRLSRARNAMRECLQAVRELLPTEYRQSTKDRHTRHTKSS